MVADQLLGRSKDIVYGTLQYMTAKVSLWGLLLVCILPFSLRASPDHGSIVGGVEGIWETKATARNFLGGITGEGLFRILDDASDAIHRTFGVALLVLDITRSLTLAAGNLP